MIRSVPEIGDEIHPEHADGDRDPRRHGALVQEADVAATRPAGDGARAAGANHSQHRRVE